MTLKYPQIGKYQLKAVLGGGGFGTVYLGHDAALDMQVALKVFDPRELANNQTQISGSGTAATSAEVLQQRFIQEARLLAKLTSHPHIVNILELGQLDDGTPYYVMPYIPHSLVDEIGKDALTAAAQAELPAELQPRRLPAAKALLWLSEILDAMAFVHQGGLVHRDIKPANILLDERGRVQICDFGIAKLPDGEYSQSGVGMGTRNYMSPEQRESAKHVDSRSDVYSIAVLAYRMLTGTLPIGRYDDPMAHAPAIGQAVNQLLLEAMAVQPAQRPQDAADFLARLKKAMASQANTAENDDNATATFVGENTAKLKAELLPLKAKITELLKQEGLLSEKSQQQLSVLADIADISDTELKALIQQTEQELSAEITPFKKWRQGVEKQLAANNGELSAELKETLLQAGLALGKTQTQLLPFLAAGTENNQVQRSLKPSASAQPNSKASSNAEPSTSKTFLIKPIAAVVIIALLGVGGWQYQSYSAAQTALKQQDNQAWQQAQSQHSEQSYQQYLVSQPNGSYRQSASQKLKELQQEAEANVQLAAEQARQQQNARSQQIRTAQQWLIKHGYTLTETGELDARTKAAIEAFEKAENLLVTGEVDATLLTKLEEAYWRKDNTAFETAKKTNTEQSFNGYLSAWLDGKFRAEAEQGITTVKAAQEQVRIAAVEKTRQEAAAKKAAEEQAIREAEQKAHHEALAKQQAEEQAKLIERYIGKLVTIPAGSFTMGCSDGEQECSEREQPVRQVSVNAFMLMETEVTFAMWDACVAEGGCSHKPEDRGWGRGNRPVINVSYNDITQQFIPWLNRTTGQRFRLPSEAEWEYAARAGSNTKYSWGNSINCSQARYGRRRGGECSNSSDGTVAVKSYSANAFGLYDMHGNVWEWTADCWNENYRSAPLNSSAWQSGDCSHRVCRGGSWLFIPRSMSVSFRFSKSTADRDDLWGGGFRLAQDAP